jgi:hypothetical protein
MDTKSLPQRTRTQEVRTTRAERGHRLAFDRFEEIEKLRPFTWKVPACSGDHAHLVNLKLETCSCEDSIYGGHVCKHLFAARIVAAKTTMCEGCGERIRVREAVEVGDDHLTFFEFDLVCRDCAEAHCVV